MNIYLLVEDDVSFCIRAKTMSEAVQICKESYLEDRKEEKSNYSMMTEIAYYNDQILQSCSLVGELKN